MPIVRRMTTLKLAMDDLEIGFDVGSQLYYVEAGPLERRGKVYLTEMQWRRMSYLLSAVRNQEQRDECRCEY